MRSSARLAALCTLLVQGCASPPSGFLARSRSDELPAPPAAAAAPGTCFLVGGAATCWQSRASRELGDSTLHLPAPSFASSGARDSRFARGERSRPGSEGRAAPAGAPPASPRGTRLATPSAGARPLVGSRSKPAWPAHGSAPRA